MGVHKTCLGINPVCSRLVYLTTLLFSFEGSFDLLKYTNWGCSSAGRAPALHAGGHRFDPVHLHQLMRSDINFVSLETDIRTQVCIE